MARPRGVKETKPRNTVAKKIATVAAQGGITPLEVMLTAMREDWSAAEKMLHDSTPLDQAEADKWSSRIAALRASAIATADKAAPYLHARLTSVDTTMRSDNIHRVVADKPTTKDEWAEKYGASTTPVIVANDHAA